MFVFYGCSKGLSLSLLLCLCLSLFFPLSCSLLCLLFYFYVRPYTESTRKNKNRKTPLSPGIPSCKGTPAEVATGTGAAARAGATARVLFRSSSGKSCLKRVFRVVCELRSNFLISGFTTIRCFPPLARIQIFGNPGSEKSESA